MDISKIKINNSNKVIIPIIMEIQIIIMDNKIIKITNTNFQMKFNQYNRGIFITKITDINKISSIIYKIIK